MDRTRTHGFALRLAPALLAFAVFAACESQPTRTEPPPRGAVVGQVTVDGVGRAGVEVFFDAGPLASRYPLSTRTTLADGAFRHDDLVPVRWTLSVRSSTIICPTVDIDVVESREHSALLECRTPQGELRGQVRIDGQPWAGATVDVIPQDAGGTSPDIRLTTDAAGEYRVDDLPVGEYVVVVVAEPLATCLDNPRASTIVDQQTTTVDFDCAYLPATVSGTVTLNGVAQGGLEVTIEDAAGTPVATATTDPTGRYTAEVPAGSLRPQVSIPRAVCPSAAESQVEVQPGAVAVTDLGCASLSGTYDATLTETSNTCSVPPDDAYPIQLDVGDVVSGGANEYTLQPGDRPQDTWPTMMCDPANRQCTGTSPSFGDGSGFTFVDTWTFVTILAGPGAPALRLQGSVEVDITFPGGGLCSRFYDVDAAGGGG